MARKRLEISRGMPLIQGIAYSLFGQKMRLFRSSPWLAVAILLGALAIIGLLVFVNSIE
jgi:formate hydrogenlyase subunit 3/multisubunit Na+/H+ antiporter MnhD subunit